MTSYAAVNSLLIMNAYEHIHRNELYKFFYSMKRSDGGFHVHLNGYGAIALTSLMGREYDCRSSYCVISICKLLNMLTPEIVRDVGDFFLK